MYYSISICLSARPPVRPPTHPPVRPPEIIVQNSEGSWAGNCYQKVRRIRPSKSRQEVTLSAVTCVLTCTKLIIWIYFTYIRHIGTTILQLHCTVLFQVVVPDVRNVTYLRMAPPPAGSVKNHMSWKTMNAKVALLCLYLYDDQAVCIYIIVAKVKLNPKVVFTKPTINRFWNVFHYNSKHYIYML